MKNKKIIIAATIALLVAAYFIGIHFYNQSERERLEALARETKLLYEREYSPVIGSDMAKVTLVEFLDPECETCRELYPFVKSLLEEYQGRLRLVIRYAPFHHNSMMVVQMLEAARKQDKYWETLELFFKYQPDWGGHHNPNPELLWTYLPEAGVDANQVRNDMSDPVIQKNIEQDIADARTLGVRQTPGFFVNGKPLQQFGFDQLRDLIESEM
ncbi:MAG: thioredoxin domain-containing protein [Bdellovibrionales bacterium]